MNVYCYECDDYVGGYFKAIRHAIWHMRNGLWNE